MIVRHFFFIVSLLFSGTLLYGQVPGVPSTVPDLPEATPADDSLYIFTPARPLINTDGLRTSLPSAFGLNALFSNSGYGLGVFYERKFSPSFSGFLDIGVTGARKGDEFQVFNRNPNSVHFQTYFVPNKVNRIWQAPIMLGVKQHVFTHVFFDNFRPFVNGGAGGSVILTTPYDQEFFGAFGDAQLHVAPGGFIGIGTEFTEKSPGPSFNARYYYLPVKSGIESLVDEPITDFGGLFLTVNLPL